MPDVIGQSVSLSLVRDHKINFINKGNFQCLRKTPEPRLVVYNLAGKGVLQHLGRGLTLFSPNSVNLK